MRKILIVSMLLTITVITMSGCGDSLRYKFPVGKTLYYTCSRSSVTDDGKTVLLNSKKSNEIEFHLTTIKMMDGKYDMEIKSAYPKGKRATTYQQGEDIGGLNFKITQNGTMSNVAGMGVPLDIRLLLPKLPEERLKKGREWENTEKKDTIKRNSAVRVVYKYLGKKLEDGKVCRMITAHSDFKKKANAQSPTGQLYSFTFIYKFDNKICLTSKGYPATSKTNEFRDRTVMDSSGAVVYRDRNKSELILNLAGIK